MERDDRENDDRNDDDRNARASLAGLVVAIVLALGGVVLALAMKDNAKLQDCIASGRRNCVPVEIPSPGK